VRFEKGAPIAQPKIEGLAGRRELDAPIKVGSSQPGLRKEIRVLVVEDDMTNQIMIMEQLRVLGYSAQVVDGGSLALEALAHDSYDVVLMDCEMPGMDGYEATAEIRQRESNGTHTQIIAVSAHVGSSQMKRCLDSGMDGYLSKPVKLQLLAVTLDAYLHTEP
jgi:CheY-like chemotaxis protein